MSNVKANTKKAKRGKYTWLCRVRHLTPTYVMTNELQLLNYGTMVNLCNGMKNNVALENPSVVAPTLKRSS